MILVFLFQFLFLETKKGHSLDTQIKTGKIPVNKVKNERGDIITYTTEVQIQMTTMKNGTPMNWIT